jgi:hypothetical protein
LVRAVTFLFVAPIESYFLGAKLPERKADKSPPSNAEVNARSFTSVLTYIRIFMAWCTSTGTVSLSCVIFYPQVNQ